MNGLKIPIPNISIDINECETVACQCGSVTWKNSMMVKRISPLQSPDGKENFANISVVICEKCGTDIRVAIEAMKTRIIN